MYPIEGSALSTEQNVLGALGLPAEPRLPGIHYLPQRTARTPETRRAGPRIKPQDLVRLILGHRALARRVTAPRARVAIQVFSPAGRHAVQISFD